jgi:hypothetical protein
MGILSTPTSKQCFKPTPNLEKHKYVWIRSAKHSMASNYSSLLKFECTASRNMCPLPQPLAFLAVQQSAQDMAWVSSATNWYNRPQIDAMQSQQ